MTLEVYFPSRFGMKADFRYFSKLKKFLSAECNYRVNLDSKSKTSRDAAAKELDKEVKPSLLDSSSGSEAIRREKEYHSLMLSLSKSGIQDPEKMSVLSYYTLVEQMEDEANKNKARSNGR